MSNNLPYDISHTFLYIRTNSKTHRLYEPPVIRQGRDVASICHRRKCELNRRVHWAKAVAFQRL